MKQESIRFLINLLISYKKRNKQKIQNKTNLLDLPNLDKIQEKLSKTNVLILSLFLFFFFFWIFIASMEILALIRL